MATGPRAGLERFERAVRLETHHLARWPGLLWQQTFNELHWDAEALELTEGELQLRCASGARPWIRARTPPRRSRALRLTLAGHGDDVSGCAVSRDGSFIVSSSDDGTLKVWDVATGIERATFTGGHEVYSSGKGFPVHDCAIAPDGAYVVWTGHDGRLIVWDRATGAVRRSLEGHRDAVRGCDVSPDGSFVVSASEDRSVRIWDPVSGEQLQGIQTYGPLIVTERSEGSETVFRGPACRETHRIGTDALGTSIECPSCGQAIRVNPFMAGQPAGPSPPKGRRLRLFRR